jgi:hypothetical protein
MTRQRWSFAVVLSAALLGAGAPALAGETAKGLAAEPAGAEICTDKPASTAQREAALRDLGRRLAAEPPPPPGEYRELNRTGLNYGSARGPAPAPPAPPVKAAPKP